MAECDHGDPLGHPRNEQYDAYYCPACYEWTSPKCGSNDLEECYFDCANRPENAKGLDG